MAKKTSINNLNIVWQGQSWSVIAPNGVVLGRFKQKHLAINFAEGNLDYVEEVYEDYPEADLNRYSDGELPDGWMSSNPYPEKTKNNPPKLDKDEIFKHKNEENLLLRAMQVKPKSYPLIRASQYLLALPILVVFFIAAMAITGFGLWDVAGRFFQAGPSGALELFLKHYVELSIVVVFLAISGFWLNVEPHKLSSHNYRIWLIWACFSFGLGIPVAFISFCAAAYYLIFGVSSLIHALIFNGNFWDVINNYALGAVISCTAFGLAGFSIHYTEDLSRNA